MPSPGLWAYSFSSWFAAGATSSLRWSFDALPVAHGDDVLDHASLGNLDGAAKLGKIFRGRRDAGRGRERRQQVADADLTVDYFLAVVAGSSVRQTPLHAATGEYRGPGIGEVVPSLASVDLRGAAEFTHPEDGGRFEQAPFCTSSYRCRSRPR